MRVVVAPAMLLLLTFSAVPAEADVLRERVAVDESVYLMPESVCVSAFCVLAADPDLAPRIFLDAQTSLTGARLVLDSHDPLLPGVEAVLRLDCDPGGPDCGGFQVEVHGDLPLEMATRGLTTPAGAVLRLYAFTRGGLDPFGIRSPHDSLEAGHSSPRVGTIQGVLRTLRDTSIDPGLVEVHEDIDWDGFTAPCLPDDPLPCDLYPSGHSWAIEPLDGPMTSLHVDVTWTARTPADETLRVAVRCYRYGYSTPHEVPCSPWPADAFQEGQSPISIALDGLTTTADSYYSIEVRGMEVPGVRETLATRQPYHLDGEYVYVVPGS